MSTRGCQGAPSATGTRDEWVGQGRGVDADGDALSARKARSPGFAKVQKREQASTCGERRRIGNVHVYLHALKISLGR